MKSSPDYEQVITEQLIATFHVASETAFLSVIDAIAKQMGVQKLDDGLSVVDSFYRRKAEEADAAIAEFADYNPTAASHVKALWIRLNSEQGQALG